MLRQHFGIKSQFCQETGEFCDKEVAEKVKEKQPKVKKSGVCTMHLKYTQFLTPPFQSFWAYFSIKWRENFIQTKALYTNEFTFTEKQKWFQLALTSSGKVIAQRRYSIQKQGTAWQFPAFSRMTYKHSPSWVHSPKGCKIHLWIIIYFTCLMVFF